MPLVLDHLAVTARTLDEGRAHVEDALGVRLAPGGKHSAMGTHNLLLSLGPALYLEVIAIDPEAPAPDRPRWFDLDNMESVPRLSNWVVATDDMKATLSAAPEGIGVPMRLERGDLRWSMAVPDDGRLPFDGACPALIEWEGAAHPASRLPDAGCTLTRLTVRHPDIDGLRSAWPGLSNIAECDLVTGPAAMMAEIATPGGARILQ